MKNLLLLSLIMIFSSGASVCAQPNALSDIQSAIIQEDYKKANDLAQAFLGGKPGRTDAAEAQYYLGLSFLRLGDYPQAHDTFKKLLSERPATDVYDKASIGLIDALYMQGLYDHALKEANALMAKRRDSDLLSLIYLKAARANMKSARWKQSQELLQKIITEYPDSFETTIARQLLEEKQYFTVQVGAFTEKDRAEKLMQEIVRRKEYAYVIETKTADGRTLFRVRVGQFTALKDARDLESKLSGLGYPTLIYP